MYKFSEEINGRIYHFELEEIAEYHEFTLFPLITDWFEIQNSNKETILTNEGKSEDDFFNLLQFLVPEEDLSEIRFIYLHKDTRYNVQQHQEEINTLLNELGL